MLGEESFAERHQVIDRLVVRICPPASELVAIRCFLDAKVAACFLDVLIANCVAVVLGVGAVTDYENLYILKEAAARPETVVLVSIDLVERLADINSAPLELDVNKRQPIHENSDVVSVLANTFNLILVEHLDDVVVDVLLIDEIDVLTLTVISLEDTDVIFLESTSLLDDSVLLT